MPEPIDSPSAQRLRALLSITGPGLFVPEKSDLKLGALFDRWSSGFATDEAKLHAVALHDFRILLSRHCEKPFEEIGINTPILSLLGNSPRQTWEEICAESEWSLPPMTIHPWVQNIFGAVFISGFILPFFYPLIGSLILPVVVPVSFWMEKKATWLEYPNLDAMAVRMVEQNKPGIILEKFAPEDIERVFFELAEMATETELDMATWRETGFSSLT